MRDPDETTKVHVPHHNRAPVIEGEPAPTKRVWTSVEMQMRATLLAPMMPKLVDAYERSEAITKAVKAVDAAMAELAK